MIVIGGSGFVGSALKQILNKKEIFILDKVLEGENYCDIRDPSTLKNKLPKNRTVLLLAAEHRDDVQPRSLYYDVNVTGTKHVLDEMSRCGLTKIIFTSSVAVYGLNKKNPNESSQVDPFNDYGKSKYEAEKILREWQSQKPKERSVTIIRPTVIFGEKNRGNVYNLIKQISIGNFIMIGNGNNSKSMAYINNITSFIVECDKLAVPGFDVYNYADKPDFTMRQLVKIVQNQMNRKSNNHRVPYWIGLTGGYFFDFLSFLLRRKFSVSSIRVRKFCATTQFDASKALEIFQPPFTIEDGIRRTVESEFL